jgi:hypothetical protein
MTEHDLSSIAADETETSWGSPTMPIVGWERLVPEEGSHDGDGE